MQSETQTVLVQINTKLDTLVTGFGSLGIKVDSLEAKVGSLENKVGSLDKKVCSLEERMCSVEDKVDTLQEEVGFIKEEMVMKDEFNQFVIRTENNFEHLREDNRETGRLSEHLKSKFRQLEKKTQEDGNALAIQIVRLEQKMNH